MPNWEAYPPDYRAEVVTAIEAAVRGGESVSVVGLSGAGKSNLLGFLAQRAAAADAPVFVLVDANRLAEPTPAAFLRLMRRALERAWSRPISRFWVHTCTLDHQAAVEFYQRSGFTAFKRGVEVVDDPRLQCASAELVPVDAGETDLELLLTELHTEHAIRGQLLAPPGDSPDGIFVCFTDSETRERVQRVAIPEPDGSFVMRNLLDRAYDLELYDPEGRFEQVRVEKVRPGGDEVELRLAPR